VKIPEGTYFVTDLIGCEVWEENSAEPLGTVRDVLITGTSVLMVDTSSGELLVPLATEICTRIDIAARRIEVRLPDGLRDLNRA
jgi:16S rRNA processing protein RimM